MNDTLHDRVQLALAETDIQGMRRRLTRAAYSGESVLGVPSGAVFNAISGLVRQTIMQAEHHGLSGEDTYTLLAYRLAIIGEEQSAQLLEMHFTRVNPIIVTDAQKEHP